MAYPCTSKVEGLLIHKVIDYSYKYSKFDLKWHDDWVAGFVL